MTTQDVMLRIEPLDSLFFRDGRPYTHNESEQVGVASQFPAPATFVGAVRASAARVLGWDGRNEWSDDIKKLLGDGETLGSLQFRGPLLLRGDDVLFSAPACLMRNSEGSIALLHPGLNRCCDLGGSVRLPALPAGIPGEGWKTVATAWVTRTGLETVLRGDPPESEAVISQDSLWSLEARVGIKRNTATRTTEEGALYSPQHMRLNRGVSFGLRVQGLPAETLTQIQKAPQPVGGEARSAWLTRIDQVPAWPGFPGKMNLEGDGLNYTVIVLSPMPMKQPPSPGRAVPGLPGVLVSACLPRALMLGGWDSVRHQPHPLKPHLAPGSTLFMRADAAEEEVLRSLHGTCIGLRPSWGYGLVAIGTWS